MADTAQYAVSAPVTVLSDFFFFLLAWGEDKNIIWDSGHLKF